MIENKEKLIRDLVTTFNDRDALHIAFKTKLKLIIYDALNQFGKFITECPAETEIDVIIWIDNFVEGNIKKD